IISATADNASESSGGSSFDGGGTSAAVNATIATNNVMGGAEASIARSSVDATGDVTVEARNASIISAEVQSAVTSAGDSVGVLMAFNSVGYRPSNILFSTINALLGGSLLVEEDAVRAAATIEDSAIDAGGSIAVIAENTAQITAVLGNEATSLSEAMF